jgi:hypothetical protein
MKEVLQNWLDGNLPLPGVAACCAQLADRTYVSRCYGDGFVTAQVERVLNRLAMAADNLGKHGLEVARLCWVFEHTRIQLVFRHDGNCLALFTDNRPGAINPKVEDLLEGFLRLGSS